MPLVASVSLDGIVDNRFLIWLFEYSRTVVSRILSVFCHNSPDRSLVLGSCTTLVCARCLGFLLLSFATVSLFWILRKLSRSQHVRLRPWIMLAVLILAGSAVLLDVVSERLLLQGSSQWIRFATGAGFGLVLAAALSAYAPASRFARIATAAFVLLGLLGAVWARYSICQALDWLAASAVLVLSSQVVTIVHARLSQKTAHC